MRCISGATAAAGPRNIHLSVERVGGWAQKSEGTPSRMTLRWLEAENGNASEDSIKIKTQGKRKP